ncbi:unnamed protein product [Absidia cylindrospora]
MSEAAFFYGTLMATEIIGDVLCGKSAPRAIKTKKLASLQLTKALLKGHRRYAVKHATYPGVLESDNTADQVHGILCQGLTLRDVAALDDYEGDEYKRQMTKVSLEMDDQGHDDQGKTTPVSCQVYLWIAGKDQLKDHDWDYEHWRQHHLPYTVV